MASSSSTSTLVRNYDVFLSFRGKDTRHTIVSHLYEALCLKRLNTFKDDERIELGDNICHRLLEAIHSSWFAVVIISVNYASSSWCLEELRTIMELRKEGQIKVIPIFFGVEPSEVRKLTGRFGIAFENYKAPEMEEKVLKWREALTQISDLAGMHSSQWGLPVDEAAMIAKVVKTISTQLQVMKPTEVIDFVALKAHMNRANPLFAAHMNRVNQKTPIEEIDFVALKAHMNRGNPMKPIEETDFVALNALINRANPLLNAHMNRVNPMKPIEEIDFVALKAHMNRANPLLDAHMKRKNPPLKGMDHMKRAKSKRPKRVDG